MIVITRRFDFDTAHRVLNHESKCNHIHGHRYVLELCVTAPKLDHLDRVIDFSVLKSVVGKWIDDNLDHNIILNSEDPLTVLWRRSTDYTRGGMPMDNRLEAIGALGALVFKGKDPYILPNANPTAEVMVEGLFNVASQLLAEYRITVVSARLYETPNCWADYSLPS